MVVGTVVSQERNEAIQAVKAQTQISIYLNGLGRSMVLVQEGEEIDKGGTTATVGFHHFLKRVNHFLHNTKQNLKVKFGYIVVSAEVEKVLGSKRELRMHINMHNTLTQMHYN